MPRRLIVPLIAAFALVPAASAHAGWIPAAALDGPNADVLSIGNVDLARDGAGVVSYLRRDGGVPHAYVVRLFAGVWRAPERIDVTTGAASEVQVAAGDGNRIAAAWIADGNVYASVVNGGDSPGSFGGIVQIGSNARNLDIDMGVNGAAYAIWESGGNIHTARLQEGVWETIATPLDVDVAREAGTGDLRPRVAVSAEGYAVATWGERAANGATAVFARRITGTRLSVAPQDLTLPGGSAAAPDIDIEDDGSFAWVVYRQDIGGVPRTVGRRLIGSLFEAAENIDGGNAANYPRVDMSGAGRGQSVSQTLAGDGVLGSWLDHDHFQSPGVLSGGGSLVPTLPVVAATDRNDLAVAWQQGLGDGNVVARARYKGDGENMGGEATVSRPDLGPVAPGGVQIGGDRVGDFAVAMVQGTEGARALSVAVFDRPPGAPFIESSQTYKRKTRPELRWRPGLELWGAQTYRVYMDGVQIGQTQNDTLVPATPLKTGKHSWQVEAVDRNGQTTRSRVRTLRIDATAPRLKVSVSGKRVAGAGLKVRVTVSDSGGAGLHHITVDYGDKSAKSRSRSTVHRYRRGTFRLKVAAVDKAGNVTRKEVRLRIKQS